MTALLLIALGLQLCCLFVLVRLERRKAKHSYIDGRQLVFTGSALGLFANWIKWLLLSIATLGIYLFWVGPHIQKWKWEHTELMPYVPGLAPQPWPAPAAG
jgi:uncharacterized membrane protein YjgN (DUF898 family)